MRIPFRCVVLAAGLMLAPGFARGEAMVQYFNTSWVEITTRIPELAEAGYASIWLPPPTKGSGGLSVGYDLWDPLDLGSIDQRSTIRTRYGTEDELKTLVETAHRFGIRIYFDNIMNHRAFDVPGYNEYTRIDIYPGMLPEDFHLRKTADGFYRKWDNTRDWNSAWQVQNLGLADLIDIAQETHLTDGAGRTLNDNFGLNEGDDYPKISFVRHPGNPEYYLDTDLPLAVTNPADNFVFTVYTFANKEPYQDTGWTTNGWVTVVGAGNGKFDWCDLNGNGQHDVSEPCEPFTDTGVWPTRPECHSATYGYGDGKYNMGNPSVEDVGAYLIRAVMWELDRTGADGFRLDAVKHVPAYFFGTAGSDTSDAGYCGGIQRQFNLTHGFSDWNNHRNSCFDTESARDDAMVFGEHLGEPPAYGDYMNAGMRLVDNALRNTLNDKLGNPWNSLAGMDAPGAGGFNAYVGVMHAQSHDNDYASCKELQHAFYFTRAQLGLLYTDGNHHSETLGESGGAFPRHANTSFLGQWGDPRVPNLLYIHNQFARGTQTGRYSDGDFVAYERVDKRENWGMSDADGTTLLFMLNDNYSSGQGRNFTTGFPAGAYLWQYARGSTGGGDAMTGFYITLGNSGGYGTINSGLLVPRGGYFAFSWKNPDLPAVRDMADSPIKTIQIVQNGQPVTDTVACVRKDGPDGDPAFNPYGLADTNQTDYSYTIRVPRLTSPSNLAFYARADGSAENILFKLDNGIDLNSQQGIGPLSGERRDNPPGQATDVYLGYEQMGYVGRYREKFAAANVASNTVSSPGAETWQVTIGNAGSWVDNRGNGNWRDADQTATWVFHDPADTQPPGGGPQFSTNAAGQAVTVWTKIGYAGTWNHVWLYYTTNGVSWPEGAGGVGGGSTHVVPLYYDSHDSSDATIDWVKGTLPAMAAGTVLRYKIGVAKDDSSSIFPADATAAARKLQVETLFALTNINAAALTVYPNGDRGDRVTGLSEGLHILRARSFLKRDNRAAIYNTVAQTFYYDALRPQGEIRFPASDGDSVGGQQYGVVVRTDPTVTEVWYHIDDADTNNDDVVTLVSNGNGNGCETFTDSNQNNAYDSGEPFTDVNGNGVWDANIGESWVKAWSSSPTAGITSQYPQEWRFNYVNIPSGGSNAAIRVRLREISSASPPGWTNMTDAAGSFTTLTRTVHAWGPDTRMFVAWPQRDGDTVGASYVMKVYFSKSMADGLSEADLLNCFTIKIQSSESGRTDGGVVQDRSAYSIRWNETDQYHALSYALPNLYNGQPDWLHGIEVTWTRAGYLTQKAMRLVKAWPVAAAPYIVIVQPTEYDSDGQPTKIIIPDVAHPTPEQRSTPIQVATETNGATVDIRFDWAPAAYTNGGVGLLSSVVSGTTRFWNFNWTNLVAGDYHFTATVTNSLGAWNSASRNAHIILMQRVISTNAFDTDYDDDGLQNDNETTAMPLPDSWVQSPKPNSETWNNGDVHVHYAYGHSDPLSCDTDNDGLPDGLEVGWRTPIDSNTDTNADTNGDGWKNFLPDLDPPFFNTLDNYGSVPGVNSASEGGDRSKRLKGSTTDPSSPDSDGDGLLDGIEDANHNGWIDGDGAPLQPADGPSLGRNWPTGKWSAFWTETDPNNPDTDGDGLSDGYGEDKDFNGRITGDTNSNRVWEAGECWVETDPLRPDTDGDGLPDGWELSYNFSPLNDGVIGHTNMATGAVIDSTESGAAGDPDGDGFPNITELANGTNPRVADTGAPLPPGSITVGPRSNVVVVGSVSNAQEFTDWAASDLIALDPYDGDGPNNQGGDVYHAYDGYDSSRDIVAFYVHDGGDVSAGGDGKFYFRVDFEDLKPYAESGYLDLYVVMDFNSPSSGEYALPDDIDAATQMRWEAVVAVYDGSLGVVYVDTDHVNNTTTINENLGAKGVSARGMGSAAGFGQAYFNSDLDCVEFSVSRQALRDAGWNGLDAADLNYQVYTTKDGTGNSPVGAGDIGGRLDIRDTIMDGWLASDYWRDQTYISQNPVLLSWCGLHAYNDRGKAAKVAMVLHGNQHILPGNQAQNLINTGVGTGYYRPVDVHEAYSAPLNLHVTPTLASAMQWAKADPAEGMPWRDGPAFNARLARMAASNVVDFLGSTFSDHMLPYFTKAFNNDNASLSRDFLQERYGVTPTASTVFWTPERVLDGDVLDKIQSMGYNATLIDQNTHLWNWFGRTFALGDGGYRINRINGVNCFVINNDASAYRFMNEDNGLNLSLRTLLSRKARNGTQDQVVVLFSNWEDFTSTANAAAYDKNIRWMASHPWIKLVSLEDILAGKVDLNGDGYGDGWWAEDHGTGLTLAKTSDDWINHACEGNFDDWYLGTAQEESLLNKHFSVRPGVAVPNAYGMLYTTGVIAQVWSSVASITNTDLARLAREILHGSVFQTAFHNEENNDLSKFSTGDFVYPDTSYDNLADMALFTQSQSRNAVVLKRVDTWLASAASLTNTQANAEDVDLDGEPEYLLANDRVFAVFESLGGRLDGAWIRDRIGGRVCQMIGNKAGYAGGETEQEGAYNVVSNGTIVAYRTAGLKDWWAVPSGGGGGTLKYVTNLYAAVAVADGWQFTSSDGAIRKTITLLPHVTALEVHYDLLGSLAGGTLYVRNGFSPDLSDLLVNGQDTLQDAQDASGNLTVVNTNFHTRATVGIGYADGEHNAIINTGAVDDDPSKGVLFHTLNMRNQAQTQQVELSGTGAFSFSIWFLAAPSDWDGDFMPNDYELLKGFSPYNPADGATDLDEDGMLAASEYIAGTDPWSKSDCLKVSATGQQPGGFMLRFPAVPLREYEVRYASSLTGVPWSSATPVPITVPSSQVYEWVDDGSQTVPAPLDPAVTGRFYRVDVRLQP